MIRRLPKENALLLRYLLAVLHGIQGNARENQMTSFNLSVCIAPSMLWPPGAPCSPEAEGEGTKKVRGGAPRKTSRTPHGAAGGSVLFWKCGRRL